MSSWLKQNFWSFTTSFQDIPQDETYETLSIPYRQIVVYRLEGKYRFSLCLLEPLIQVIEYQEYSVSHNDETLHCIYLSKPQRAVQSVSSSSPVLQTSYLVHVMTQQVRTATRGIQSREGLCNSNEARLLRDTAVSSVPPSCFSRSI